METNNIKNILYESFLYEYLASEDVSKKYAVGGSMNYMPIQIMMIFLAKALPPYNNDPVILNKKVKLIGDNYPIAITNAGETKESLDTITVPKGISPKNIPVIMNDMSPEDLARVKKVFNELIKLNPEIGVT